MQGKSLFLKFARIPCSKLRGMRSLSMFKPGPAKDLYKISKKNKDFGAIIINQIIPEILKNPLRGRMKQGDLKRIRSKDFDFKGISYRILYEMEGEIVRIYAIGVHDVSYRKAKSRKK